MIYLASLDLSHNRIVTLQNVGIRSRLIVILRLNENRITSLEGVDIDLNKLTDLNLANNQISNLSNVSFGAKNKLNHLNLGFNKISDLTTINLENLFDLKTLDIRNNEILTYKNIVFNLNNLTRVFISIGNLSSIELCHLKRSLNPSISKNLGNVYYKTVYLIDPDFSENENTYFYCGIILFFASNKINLNLFDYSYFRKFYESCNQLDVSQFKQFYFKC